MITTKVILDHLASLDASTLSGDIENARAIQTALVGFEQSAMYTALLANKHSIRLAFGLGMHIGYLIRNTEDMEKMNE